MSATQKEALDLIRFYNKNGWDWTDALCFTLCRRLFGDGFHIGPRPKQPWEYPRKPRSK